jgi:hypothetical protein
MANTKMSEADQNHKKSWLISIGVALWVSFLSAGAATMLFFSAFDPSILVQVATYPMELNRSSGYSIGFLLFWALLFSNGLIVALLVKRKV